MTVSEHDEVEQDDKEHCQEDGNSDGSEVSGMGGEAGLGHGSGGAGKLGDWEQGGGGGGGRGGGTEKSPSVFHSVL